MGIEERISKGLESRLGTFLKSAEQALMAEKNRVLRPFGLSVPQYAVLHALSVAPLSGAQLARVCCVTPQSMASLLSTMESKKLVERSPSDVHAQVLVAKLTRTGHATFRKADAAALAVEARLSAAFSPDEDRSLRALLRHAVTTLSTG
ncbi:MarR family winged helix-turn-helix transcriptional regulator [Amycolatopsis sp. H20-H5]|uniref:MarR family winged helix-turn-helix transcriptional regulator n=1 Tax=Amycolatopsis sp. H20-H5 TaxID=3046309 RepID=UPI002DBDCFD9|nr:MarR family transcriptional regulator [Amycolatopsis sp. H20-H5]MEC3977379.1 MarR family transcriptional regulator [Amycolatopsis sp. H20-H5]